MSGADSGQTSRTAQGAWSTTNLVGGAEAQHEQHEPGTGRGDQVANADLSLHEGPDAKHHGAGDRREQWLQAQRGTAITVANRVNDNPAASTASRLVRLDTGSSSEAAFARWAQA